MQGGVARKLDTVGSETATHEITFRPSLWEHLRARAKSTITGEKIEEVLLMTLLTAAILSWGGFLLYLCYLLQAYQVV